jgi:hypothetical protein
MKKLQYLVSFMLLLSIGDRSYLEIVAKDPNQKVIPDHWIPADQYLETKLIGWASTQNELQNFAHKHKGILGNFAKMSRKKPDGSLIHWQMTYPRFNILDGLIPFYIDWMHTPHPGTVLQPAGHIDRLSLGHPDSVRAQKHLLELGIDIEVVQAQNPTIHCELVINNNRVIL